MKTGKCLICLFTILTLTACLPTTRMTSRKMNKLELGMSKKQVTTILGRGYTIAEKRMDNNVEIEILSYRDFHKNDEFYLFLFTNNKLEKWYRELLPKYEIKGNPLNVNLNPHQ
jgi:hypothetical protein